MDTGLTCGLLTAAAHRRCSSSPTAPRRAAASRAPPRRRASTRLCCAASRPGDDAPPHPPQPLGGVPALLGVVCPPHPSPKHTPPPPTSPRPPHTSNPLRLRSYGVRPGSVQLLWLQRWYYMRRLVLAGLNVFMRDTPPSEESSRLRSSAPHTWCSPSGQGRGSRAGRPLPVAASIEAAPAAALPPPHMGLMLVRGVPHRSHIHPHRRLDTDVVFFHDPYPFFKSEFGNHSLFCLSDSSVHAAKANGGVWYLQVLPLTSHASGAHAPRCGCSSPPPLALQNVRPDGPIAAQLLAPFEVLLPPPPTVPIALRLPVGTYPPPSPAHSCRRTSRCA